MLKAKPHRELAMGLLRTHAPGLEVAFPADVSDVVVSTAPVESPLMKARRNPVLLIGLALALVFGACERVGEPSAPVSAPPSAAVVRSRIGDLTLVEGTIPPGLPSLQVSQLIGP